MKNKALLTASLLASSLSIVAFTACSKSQSDQVADKTKEAYQDTKTAVSDGWDKVKGYTFDKRSDFSKSLEAQQKALEADISKMQANYADAQASDSRKAAMADLKDSDADYKAKLTSLGNATADTWTSARDNVSAAWDRLQASYAKARAEK
jgi:Skp family chaperone for outer membrane proteins